MITGFSINNFKSIENVDISIDSDTNIMCFLGKNGAGKSNIFKAFRFFFDNLNKDFCDDIGIDRINPYIQKCTISISFNVHLLKVKSENNSKLESDFKILKNYFVPDKSNQLIKLTMTQNRDGTIMWNIRDRAVRGIIKNLFPFYYIDTRHLDLYSWSWLWKIINDLSATKPQVEPDKFNQIIDTAFSEVYGKKYTDSKNILSKCFDDNLITLDKYHFENRLANAFAMRFGGDHFLINERTLDFYSDGTNSVQYLKLLTSLIPQISVTSCKFPIIIVDEPEIGLHNSFIREYIDCVCNNIKSNAFLFISTHSPKIIEELALRKTKYELYKVEVFRLHSILKKMNLSWLKNENARISIKETECYFSDYLVYVEGETELQLFSNERILSLYPQIKKIHFYSFDSNDARLKNAHSGSLNLGIAYKVIIDMDKIVTYIKNSSKFKLKSDSLVCPIKNNQKNPSDLYRYYNQHTQVDMISLRKKIESLLKLSYSPSSGLHYFCDNNYSSLVQSIKSYCEFYNVIVNKTTIEGELITSENLDKFMLYLDALTLNKETQRQHHKIKNLPDCNEKTVQVICECNGRSELQDSCGLKHKSIIGGKTSGWCSKWLDFYFLNYIDPITDDKDKIKQFEKDFPSLNSTLQILKNMVQ